MAMVNVLLLAPLKQGSGNLSTAARIRDYFNESESYRCLLEDVNDLKSRQQLLKIFLEQDIHVVIAIHALHSGSILTGDKFRNTHREVSKVKSRKSAVLKQHIFHSGDGLGFNCSAMKVAVLSENGHWLSNRMRCEQMIERKYNMFYRDQRKDRSSLDGTSILRQVSETENPARTLVRKRRQSFPVDCCGVRGHVRAQRRKRSRSQTAAGCEHNNRRAPDLPLSAAVGAKRLRLHGRDLGRDDESSEDPMLGVPYAVICAGTDINEFSKDPAALLTMSSAIYRANHVVSFSQPLLKKIITIWPNLRSNTLLEIPQAVTTCPSEMRLSSLLQRFGVSEGATIFTIIAGVRPVKDPLFLVKAFSDWHQRFDRTAFLVIIGPMMDKRYGERFTRNVDESVGVIYLGGLSLPDTHAAIRDSFALVNSSVSEGMSTAILEAMHLGTPVIAKDIEGNSAVIENEVDGLLYQDARGFLKAAERLQRDRDLYRLIVQNAKHKIQTRHACDREREAYFSLVNRLSVSVKDGRCHTAMNTTAWENGYHAVA